MPGDFKKPALLIFAQFLYCACVYSQIVATIPWSSTLNVTFGKSAPAILAPNRSDFTYTFNGSPANGSYTIVPTASDVGHLFFGAVAQGNREGYKMQARFNASTTSKALFRDTVRNLCGNSKYLFWAYIINADGAGCLKPELTFSIETTTGIVIKTHTTGKIGGSFAEDDFSCYYGYFDARRECGGYYGIHFDLPAGTSDIVVKISTTPTNLSTQCSALLEMDNIVLMPVGPTVRIGSSKFLGGYLAFSCYQGNIPLELQGKIEPGYYELGVTPTFVPQVYTNPAFQWEQSLDEGYTWTDIPGETAIDISHIFNIPDTFWVRLRVSESADIANKNCSNVSNIIKVQVEEPLKDFTLTTNSPVCTDGDLQLMVSGAAKYKTYGPNGFFDDSGRPHVYHPNLADSGWYYSEAYTLGGCKSVDSAYVQILGPAATFITPDRLVCYGDTIHLQASGGIKYAWTPSGGLSSAAIANPIASPVSTTAYEVKITDANGCSDYKTTMVTLRNGLLTAAFEAPDVVCPNETVTFANASQGQIIHWQWNFGNGNTSTLREPPAQHYPVTNQFLAAGLTVTDTSGCTRTLEKLIHTVDNCFIAVATAFTPNNDGRNDFFQPLNAYKATNLVFSIFNRYGQLIFMTRDWTKTWDGTRGGVPQSAGVYVWMLNYTDESKKPVFLKGTVTLIR